MHNIIKIYDPESKEKILRNIEARLLQRDTQPIIKMS